VWPPRQVGRGQLAVTEHVRDGVIDPVGGLSLTEVAQQQHR
jgi:hypothetical protein